MRQLILVLNTGSSSIKFSVFEPVDSKDPCCIREGEIKGIGTLPAIKIKSFPEGKVVLSETIAASNLVDALHVVENWIDSEFSEVKWLAVGHRIVHGGEKFIKPIIIDEEVLVDLRKLVPLDPLHLPIGISAIETCLRIFSNVPQIACFDTSFHTTQPLVATLMALPQSLTGQGIRRYGFHGISYEFVVSMLSSLDSTLATGRTIIAHLGSGASLCALKNGKSVATTMGFSVLDGLVMGTRCGSIDPGAILYILNSLKVAPAELEDILYNKSGLLGISGISSDVKTLLESSETKAKNALEHYVYRIVREAGSLVAAIGGLDGIVFTGGVGENSSEIRQRVVTQLSWLGLEIDTVANDSNALKISASNSKIPAYVVSTHENFMIAREVSSLLKSILDDAPGVPRIG